MSRLINCQDMSDVDLLGTSMQAVQEWDMEMYRAANNELERRFPGLFPVTAGEAKAEESSK